MPLTVTHRMLRRNMVFYNRLSFWMRLFLITPLIFVFLSFALAMGNEAENSNETKEDSELVLCTMDAKLCPDKSYVSRVPPHCKFALCPSEKLLSKEEKLIDITITGSAETPDPVSERIFELERKGLVFNLIIRESFPVQIQMEATQQTIDELESIPRIKSQHSDKD